MLAALAFLTVLQPPHDVNFGFEQPLASYINEPASFSFPRLEHG
jgi:hypothetical protein